MSFETDEKMLDMSLDDYIQSFKETKRIMPTNENCDREGNFKEGRRQQKDDDVDDEEIGEGIWQGPESSTNFLSIDLEAEDLDLAEVQESTEQAAKPNYDLRQKITGQLVPNRNSAQWRLMYPNVIPSRPAGMPPLVPLDAPADNREMRNKNYNNNYWRKNNRNRNYNNNNKRDYNNWGSNSNKIWDNNNIFNNWGYNNNNHNNHSNSWANNNNHSNSWANNCNNNNSNNLTNNRNGNNGRIERFYRKNGQLNSSSKNIKLAYEQLTQRNPMAFYPNTGQVNDMTVQCSNEEPSSSSKDFQVSVNGFYSDTPSRLTFNTSPVVTKSTAAAAATANSNDQPQAIKSLLGITQSLKHDMLPILATKLLEFIQEGQQQTVHKPIYDMKIQRDIHQIQNKPILFRCPGGDVISCDGKGIDCKIQPRTSGISLNNRFA